MSMERESLINQIYTDKMNSICFDCGAENPVFISVNNGIFLCNQCASVHMSFPQGISIIENNDLYELSEDELKYLAFGGNTRLNDFILDEFPKLENYSQKLLYKTRGMDYYRKRLEYYVYGGTEPRKPSQIVGCQLIPENFYSQNKYVKKTPKKFEPKTRTYKPEEHLKSRKFNINKRNDDDYDEEEDFFRDPFMNESKFGMNEGNMFKKFFGNDFFGMDDDLFGFGGDKLNQTQRYEKPPVYQEKPKPVYNIRGPKDNLSKSSMPGVYQHKVQQRPLTASHPIFVPSRKHKYIKKEDQNNNNPSYLKQTNPYQTKANNNQGYYENSNNSDKYNPFKRRDSTDLITLSGKDDNNMSQNKRNQKPHEIPLEFHKQASRLGEITDAINENDEESLSENNEKNDDENGNNSDSSAELDRIAENNTHIQNPNDIYDENQITFKNSIRNKYKKKKSEQIMENIKKEEKLRNSKLNNPKENNQKNNINRKPSKKGNDFKKRKSNENSNFQFDKKFSRRLSKMNITSTNWNINQLGDINTYPDAMEIED